MDRLVLAGFALAAMALAGLLAADLVGTAHASRGDDPSYLVAVSRGPALSLVRTGSTAPAEAFAKQLTCSRLVAVGEVSLGLHCHRYVTGGL